MALADRTMAMFFSNQLEEGEGERGRKREGEGEGMVGVAEGVELFKSKAERLFVRSKLAGPGPWAELTEKLQITHVERDLMMTFESASLAERINIFKKVIPPSLILFLLFS